MNFRPVPENSEKGPGMVLSPGYAIVLWKRNEPPVHWSFLKPANWSVAWTQSLPAPFSPPF